MAKNNLNKMVGKKINNPFIKQNRNRKFKKRCLICLIFTILFLILVVYLVFFTNIFKIKKIEINDLREVEKSEIEEKVKSQIESKNYFFPQKNILFFSKTKLLDQLADYNFLEINLKKSLISGLKIKISERELKYILEEDNYLYYLDESANIVKKQEICPDLGTNIDQNPDLDYNNIASSTDSSDNALSDEEKKKIEEEKLKNCNKLKDELLKDNFYPLIENINKNDSKIDLSKKQAKISQEYLNFANKIFNYLGIGDDFRVKKFIIDESHETIKVKLNNDILVLFNLKTNQDEDDQNEQINRFLLLKKEYRDKLKNVEYIDIRYGDKIYYR